MAETKAVHNMHEAKTQLSRLVERALAGEEVIIGRAGKGLVKLVPVKAESRLRSPGMWAGKVRIGDDFDDPLPDEILKAFNGDERQE